MREQGGYLLWKMGVFVALEAAGRFPSPHMNKQQNLIPYLLIDACGVACVSV